MIAKNVCNAVPRLSSGLLILDTLSVPITVKE
jgi:hypothetical protein